MMLIEKRSQAERLAIIESLAVRRMIWESI